MFNIFRKIYSKGIEFNAQNFVDTVELNNPNLYQQSPEEILEIILDVVVLENPSSNQLPGWRAWLEITINQRYGAAQGKTKTELATERKLTILQYRSIGVNM